MPFVPDSRDELRNDHSKDKQVVGEFRIRKKPQTFSGSPNKSNWNNSTGAMHNHIRHMCVIAKQANAHRVIQLNSEKISHLRDDSNRHVPTKFF